MAGRTGNLSVLLGLHISYGETPDCDLRFQNRIGAKVCNRTVLAHKSKRRLSKVSHHSCVAPGRPSGTCWCVGRAMESGAGSGAGGRAPGRAPRSGRARRRGDHLVPWAGRQPDRVLGRRFAGCALSQSIQSGATQFHEPRAPLVRPPEREGRSPARRLRRGRRAQGSSEATAGKGAFVVRSRTTDFSTERQLYPCGDDVGPFASQTLWKRHIA